MWKLLAAGVVVAGVAGCLAPGDVHCNNGLTCPASTVCDETHALCVTEAQKTVCNGAADFTDCAAVDSGRCYDDVCLPAGCGNSLRDPEEMCDDGNTNPGDGCSAECFSTEKCRNGVVDLINDEECDDGNAESHDGCSSNCRAETPAWIPHSMFVGRARPSIAYDSWRARIVLYGGRTSRTGFGDTFEWDGHRWTSIPTTVSPGQREDTAIAFDEHRGVTVLFGGYDGGDRNDVWEWDGATWQLRTPVGPPPPPRNGHALAYDPTLEKVVLFGGASGAADLDDTWTWDGTKWEKLTSTGPAARHHHSMTLDPVRHVLVMFGGLIGSSDTPTGDTWELASGVWTRRMSAGPLAGGDGLLSFDPLSGKVLLTAHAGATVNWFLDGTAWTQAGTSPSSFTSGAITTDMHRGRTVVLDKSGQTWNWTAAGWQPIAIPESGAPGYVKAVAARDGARHRVLIVGGVDLTSATAEIYLWDGTARQLSPTGTPPTARYASALAHDDERDQFVLFGGGFGSTGATPLGDFYTSPDGIAWTQRATPPVSPRYGHVMVYDAARKVTVLFGGNTGAAAPVDETWKWDGTTWTQYTGPTRPPGREFTCAAYDPVRQRVVLFSGYNQGQTLGDTWEWDGTSWSKIVTLAAPSPRSGCAMAWDAGRRTLVMQGGSGGNATDTWTWDGTAWAQLPIARAAPGGVWHVMFTSLDGDGVTIHGLGSRDDFVQLHWQSSSPAEHCGPKDGDGDGVAGCLDLDCWPTCTPECPPATSCMSMPKCGDGMCNAIEDCWTCSADCGACTN